MRRQAELGVWIWNAAISKSNIVWEDRPLQTEKMIGVTAYWNLPEATCPDSLLMAQAYPQPGNPL
jgi:hypothetical protein